MNEAKTLGDLLKDLLPPPRPVIQAAIEQMEEAFKEGVMNEEKTFYFDLSRDAFVLLVDGKEWRTIAADAVLEKFGSTGAFYDKLARKGFAAIQTKASMEQMDEALYGKQHPNPPEGMEVWTKPQRAPLPGYGQRTPFDNFAGYKVSRFPDADDLKPPAPAPFANLQLDGPSGEFAAPVAVGG